MKDNFNIHGWNKKRYLTEGLSEDQLSQSYRLTDKGKQFLVFIDNMLEDSTLDANKAFDEAYLDSINPGLGLDTKEFIKMMVAGGLVRPE